MNQQEMVQSLRAEMAKLQRVIDLLVEQPSVANEVPSPGRPKGSGTRAASFNPGEFAPKKGTMSAEGKARIAAAQKKRWAAQKGLAADHPKRGETAGTKRTSKTALPNSVGKAVPAAVKKSSRAGKRKISPDTRSQVSPAKRAAAVSNKSAGKKSATKHVSKSATKRPAKRAVTTAAEV